MQQYVSTEQLAQLVTRARRKRGWDMQQASEATGLALSTISSLETMRHPGRALQRTTLHKLADAYALTDAQLAQAAGVEQPEQDVLLPARNGNGHTPADGTGPDWLTTLVGAWPHLDTEDQEALAKLAVRFTARVAT